jgi:hypothetical protein
VAVAFEEEDRECGKLGRYSDADEQLVRRFMGPWFLKTRRSWPSDNPQGTSPRAKLKEHQAQVLMSRSNTIALGIRYTPRKQAIVKVGFCPKSRRGAIKQILYVTRRRPQDLTDAQYEAPQVWDGFGLPVGDEDIVSTPERWDLSLDEDNLSKRARMLLAQGQLDTFHALGGRERLRNILTWHFILSIEENDEALVEPFRAAVRKTVDTAFTAQGHVSLWAIHADAEHMHAHIIVKALSDFGGRIHSDIRGDYLHDLRETFAGDLRRVGLEYEATRRVARKPLRDQIMAGREPLSGASTPWIGASLSQWSQVFGQTAVENLNRMEIIRNQVKGETLNLNYSDKVLRAAELIREQLDQASSGSRWWNLLIPRKKKKVATDNLTKAEWELLQPLEGMYHDPRLALESWRLMASDGGYRGANGAKVSPSIALAIWTLCHRPELFGSVKSWAYQVDMTPPLKQLLRRVRLWAPEHLPKLGKNDNTYQRVRRQSKAHKDRAGVLAELSALHSRLDRTWPGTSWERSVAIAIKQAMRVQVNDHIAHRKDSDRADIPPAHAVPRKPISSASDGGEGGIKPPELQPPHQPPTQNMRKTTRPKKQRGLER